MVSTIVLGQVQRLELPKVLTRSQLLDKYLKNYEGKDGTCKDVIEAAKSIGVKVIYKNLVIPAATQDDVTKEDRDELEQKFNDLLFSWVKEHGYEPSCFKIKNVKTIRVD